MSRRALWLVVCVVAMVGEARAMPLSPAQVLATGRAGMRHPRQEGTLEEEIDSGMLREYDGTRYVLEGAPDYRDYPGLREMVWAPYEAKGWAVEAVYEGPRVTWVFTPAAGPMAAR